MPRMFGSPTKFLHDNSDEHNRLLKKATDIDKILIIDYKI